MKRSRNPETMERIRGRLERLYPEAPIDGLMRRVGLLEGRYGLSSTRRGNQERWDETDAILIAYGDSILEPGKPPLQALTAFVSNRLDGLIPIVHVLPFFPYSSDDGFSVIDYRMVNPDLGTWADLAKLGDAADLMVDLVINHVSRQSEWFRHYLMDVAPYRDYFIEVDPATDLSGVTRPRDLPLLSEVSTARGKRHVWTTFSRDQIDVNMANPDVLFEYLDILLGYLARGARLVRLDAVGFLWKRPGTPCIHLPETHDVVKLFRDIVETVAPKTILVTETNVPHAENISYFGAGDEAHMVYQFSLPPLLLHALQTGNAQYLNAWASRLAPPPPGCTFLNFTASHDGIGVRPLTGLVPEAEIAALVEGVQQRGGQVSMKRNPDGSTSPYELNITYFSALSDPEDHDQDLHVQRFLCSQIAMLGLRGIPALYIHSLTATANDLAGMAESGRARSINRMRWKREDLETLLDDPESPGGQVFSELLRALRARAACPAFHPEGPQRHLPGPDSCFQFLRESPDGSVHLLAIHNLTREPQRIDFPPGIPQPGTQGRDLLSGETLPVGEGATIDLKPYGCRWIQLGG